MSNISTPCSMGYYCRNGSIHMGALSKCALCRLSPDNKDKDMAHYWSAVKGAQKGLKHPDLVAEIRDKKFKRRIAKLQEKRSRDISKRKISRQASQAEKKTEANIIHATRNSGRVNKDGDHVLHGSITLDTKLQTTRSNPVILLSELEKVREDSKRAGTMIGGLVIRNKNNVGCVVLTEEDFAMLVKLIGE